MATKAKIGVLGASGYTGGELVRVLLRHPRAEIALLTAERSAGKAMRDVFPQFSPFALPQLVAIDGIDWKGAALDVDRARRLVEAFARYRVFLFSSRNECLFDSLALIEFLARYDIYPDWVFGVQTRPFAAHCWVQHGDIVFNDTVEYVGGFTPIMVV